MTMNKAGEIHAIARYFGFKGVIYQHKYYSLHDLAKIALGI